MMRTRAVITAFLLLVVIFAYADFTSRDWRYYKDLSGPLKPAVCAMQLDAEVLAGARLDLSDLRLITHQGIEQPYEVYIHRGKQRVQTYEAKMYNLTRVPGKGTRFELDLGTSGKPINQISIQSPDRDFRYQVTVEGSPDSRNWVVVRKGAAIFDFSGEVHARSTVVKLPETTYRYLHVTVHEADGRLLNVSGASAEQEIERRGRRIKLKPVSTRIVQDLQRRATDVFLDLGHRNQPCDQAEVIFEDDNVSRGCQVSVSENPAGPWSARDAGVIFRYHTATFAGEQTRLSFPELRGRYVRISVLNWDNEPIQVTGAKLYAVPRVLLFEWDPRQPVRLYYGADAPGKPQYDPSIMERLRQAQPRVGLALGPQQGNPEYRPPQKPWTEQRPWLLWLVIAVAVLVVGGMILRMMSQVAGSEGGEDVGEF